MALAQASKWLVSLGEVPWKQEWSVAKPVQTVWEILRLGWLWRVFFSRIRVRGRFFLADEKRAAMNRRCVAMVYVRQPAKSL
jgi:hypothetical protein